jgi:hypothetical protein
VPLRLTRGADASAWAIAGNDQHGREGLEPGGDKMGLTHVTCQFHNLPVAFSDRESQKLWHRGYPETRGGEYSIP